MNENKLLIMILVIFSVISNSAVTAGTLGEAVNEGDIEEVKRLIEEGNDVNSKDFIGRPLLNAAAARGRLEIAEYLISKGADINCRDQDGLTPLHAAAFYAQKEISIILISKGADINSKDNFGLTPLHAAAGGSYSKEFDMNVTLATMAAMMSFDEDNAASFKDISEILISKGAVVNAKGKDGYTPLHWAAEFGREQVVELLISRGADVNSRTKGGFFKKGKTPLGLAVEAENKEVVEILKQHGAEE